MNKVAIAIIVIAILGVLAFIAVPFDGNPLYQAVTHIEVKYSAQPEYASPLSDCQYNVTARAYKDFKSKFLSIKREEIKNRLSQRHRFLEFVKQYATDYNFTLTLNITITNNSTGQIIYQRILNIYELYDKEIHIYRNTSEIKPCTYIKLQIQLHIEFYYKFVGNLTQQTLHFSKTIEKERIIHVSTSPVGATEYQLYTKEA